MSTGVGDHSCFFTFYNYDPYYVPVKLLMHPIHFLTVVLSGTSLAHYNICDTVTCWVCDITQTVYASV